MSTWLEANPGKSERDWLLEERCQTDVQRQQFQEFLDFCDKNGIELMIPSGSAPINDEMVEYDFMIEGFGSVYDLDTPDELYTGKNGYNEQGWMPFLYWKWVQYGGNGRSFPKDLEKDHQLQFEQSYSRKWNDPEVLATLEKWAKHNK